MTPYRILLISNRPPKSIWNLACRIERELPSVRISGIVTQAPPQGIHRAEGGRRRIVDSLLGFVHGGVRPESIIFEHAELARECARKQWPLLASDNSSSQEIAVFARDCQADLALIVGTPSAAATIQKIPRYGSLGVQVSHFATGNSSANSPAQSSSGSERRPFLSIEPAFSMEAAQRVISVQIPVQTLDTPATTGLVRDLIANDLFIQAVSSLSCGKISETGEKLSSWAHEMLASCFATEAPKATVGGSQTLQGQSRPTWKLRPKRVLSMLVLFSPYTIARNWYRRWTGRFPVLILFHHLVSNRPHRMGIATETFLHEVEFLQRHYRIVSLSEGLEILRSGSCKLPTVCFTFDDGYEDNFLYLRSVTEAKGMPLTLFVCTNQVDSRREFQHDLTKGVTGFRALGWDQIRYWQSDRVEFGSHTRSHLDCGTTDIRVLEEEIAGSRADMQGQLAAAPRYFAFPWGRVSNMSRDALRIATSLYECSFSTLASANFVKKGSARKVLGRKPLPASLWELELTVQSIFDFSSQSRSEYNGRDTHAPNRVIRVSDAVEQK
jgi:hypothetical protein